MKNRTALLLAIALLAAGHSAGAGLVVIANVSSGVDRLTHDEVVNIFMGRYGKLPSGITALPLDEAGNKASFYRTLIGKELPEVNSYRARLMFSGLGSPPRLTDNVDEVIETVVNNKGAIGYIDKAKVDRRVKIILDLSQ
ncbi:MAG TPA: hypothetical protein VF386_09765 [Usitatibacter sp.]